MPLLKIENLSVSYNGSPVLKNLSLDIDSNQRWAVIGKNGTGKSTLVKTIAALLKPDHGNVYINNKPVFEYSARERARQIAYVPQKPEAVIPYTVHDFVMLGRYSMLGPFQIPSEKDRNAVGEALDFCDVGRLGGRMMTALSGGEVQRVLLAGALAQEAPILLLDEPTTFLDPAHERMFFRALGTAHNKKGLTIIMVTHDINTAFNSCTHIAALLEGSTFYAGNADIFRERCPQALNELYGTEFISYTSREKKINVYGTWGSS